MARRRLGLAEKRLVPFEADGNVTYADDRPRAFHRSAAVGYRNGAEPSLAAARIAFTSYFIIHPSAL